jgi:hypothetical protein
MVPTIKLSAEMQLYENREPKAYVIFGVVV